MSRQEFTDLANRALAGDRAALEELLARLTPAPGDVAAGAVSSGGVTDDAPPTLAPAKSQLDTVPPVAPGPDPSATVASPSPAPPSPAPPKLFGDYEILATIARGGMGVVYKARQRSLNRIVALKMILAGQFADQADIDRFYAEASAAAQLRHPHIVGIHEVGHIDGQHYFSMEYIEGESLASRVHDHPLPPREAAELTRTIAAAMHYAHERGVLHRDLKPSNVLVDMTGEPLVTDFGLAKRAEGQSQMTVDGTVLGTPSYMPPEQAAGRLDQISVRSDVYSLGATLYELLTGKPPFGAGNLWETIKQVKEVEPVPPRVINPGVPADLDTISLKCLQKEPEKRYATALELAEELHRFLDGEPIHARPVGFVERGVRWCRRNPRVAAASAAAVFFLVAALATAVTGWIATSRALQTAEASIDQMRVAIDDLFRIVADDDLLNEPGSKPLRRKLLSRARDLYRQALDRLGGNDPEIESDLARSHFLLARILRELEEPDEALGPLARARKLQTRLLEDALQSRDGDTDRLQKLQQALGDTLNLTGQLYEHLAKYSQALAVYDEAIALRQALADTAQNHEFQRQLVNSQMNSGLIHVAMLEQTSGDERDRHLALARDLLYAAEEGRQQLLAEFPSDAALHWDAAKSAYNLAQLAFRSLDRRRGEIDRLQSQTPPSGDAALPSDQQRQLAELRQQAADALHQTEQHLDDAFTELQVLLGENAADDLAGFRRIEFHQVQRLHALCMMLRGLIGDAETAQTSYAEARRVLERLVVDNPQSHEYREALAGLLMLTGDLHFSLMTPQGDAAALESYDRSIAIWHELVDRFPGLRTYDQQLEFARERRRNMQKEIESPAVEGAPEA